MKRLHRSDEDRKIAGVCAGLGEYFELDPVFFRLFFLFSILFGGLGLLAYVVLWILMPLAPGTQSAAQAGKRLQLSAQERMIGERRSHTWFVLTYLLGYDRVRNYDGSWTEWVPGSQAREGRGAD